MKRLVSGIKPTGDIHIGNYFGAMRQMIDMQQSHDCYLFVADLHAFNQIQNPAELKKSILEIAKAYLAIGIDPERVTLFQESLVPAHSELTVILNSLTSLGLLERAHAVKDAKAHNRPINAGLFEYPVLMAADILLYDAEVVPVGQDQQQHLEMAREIAERFNHLFGETFVLPQPIHGDTESVKGLDGRKMSKSYNNEIGLFESPESATAKVMRIVTDSKGPNEPKDPESCNIFALHRLFSTDSLSELKQRYEQGAISYKESKEILAANMNAFLDPIRKRKAELDGDEENVKAILVSGSQKARVLAEKKVGEIREKIGMSL